MTGRLTAGCASLHPLAEGLVATGVWHFVGRMFRSAAAITAAAGGNWSCAEEHHRTAIYQADSAPYCVAQPNARESYAAMLLARAGEGDRRRARLLLMEALRICETVGMPWQAKALSERVAQL